MQFMGKPHTQGTGLYLYEGKTLEECVPEAVGRIVEDFDPLKIILFGSLARDESNYHSDIDLLVVFPEMKRDVKHDLTVEILRALTDLPAPKDVVVADLDEIERRGNLVGTVLRPALREGKVVYERSPKPAEDRIRGIPATPRQKEARERVS